jgi:hypothetical protein
MFDDTIQTINLYQAMDRIRNRFGSNAITHAAAMRPE